MCRNAPYKWIILPMQNVYDTIFEILPPQPGLEQNPFALVLPFAIFTSWWSVISPYVLHFRQNPLTPDMVLSGHTDISILISQVNYENLGIFEKTLHWMAVWAYIANSSSDNYCYRSTALCKYRTNQWSDQKINIEIMKYCKYRW